MKTLYRQTSDFGAIEPVRNGVHTGIDLAMPVGEPLRSVVDGWVTKVWAGDGTLGKGVTIKGVDGREYIYGHMDSVAVKVGEAVNRAGLIGESGNTGNSSGPHLHFAVRENGQYVDPTRHKETLDSFAITYEGPSNTRESMELCPQSDSVSWYDVEGKMQAAIDAKACETKLELIGWLQGLGETVADLSYTIALIGGGILIVLRVAGMTRATKYFGVLQVTHLMIRFLLGGGMR
jgi:hypothetical protein